MRACWTYSPGDRITFRSIVEELVPYQNEDFRLHAYYHTQPNPVPQTHSTDQIHQDDEEELLLDHENYNDEDEDSEQIVEVTENLYV